MIGKKDIKNLAEKIEGLKREHRLDLSLDEDLSIAVMNLISLEEHFFFTAAKTGKQEYYGLIDKVREIRKDLMKKIVKKEDGEIWCASKHLLAASMRLIEAGAKCQRKGDKDAAENMFSKAYELYSIFWGLNLGIIEMNEAKKLGGGRADKAREGRESKDDLTEKLNKLVQDLINCCEE